MWYSSVLLPFPHKGINIHELLNSNKMWEAWLIFQFSGLNASKEQKKIPDPRL